MHRCTDTSYIHYSNTYISFSHCEKSCDVEDLAESKNPVRFGMSAHRDLRSFSRPRRESTLRRARQCSLSVSEGLVGCVHGATGL